MAVTREVLAYINTMALPDTLAPTHAHKQGQDTLQRIFGAQSRGAEGLRQIVPGPPVIAWN
jgi:hypothetical protein